MIDSDDLRRIKSNADFDGSISEPDALRLIEDRQSLLEYLCHLAGDDGFCPETCDQCREIEEILKENGL